jgi:hypothetical protein
VCWTTPFSDVVQATVFVTDRAFLAGVTEVVLKGLVSPELLMEVDITAVTTDTTT